MILNHLLHQSPDMIYDYLTNMQKYTSIHPLIYKVDHIKDQSYLVHEQFLSSPVSFSYPAIINGNAKDRTVEMSAVIFKFITLKMKFIILAREEKSMVHEEINIDAPFPIKNIMEVIFKKQHHKLFENMNNVILPPTIVP
jgi:hypothetical protein